MFERMRPDACCGLVVVFIGLMALATPADAQWTFIRGDSNGDGAIDIADPIGILGTLFQSQPTACLDAMDANDDGAVNIADPVNLLDVLFGTAGAVPPAPFPACGDDPTADTLDCVGPVASCPALPTGCQDNNDCPTGEYCEKAVGDCNGTGACAVMPFICALIFDPVCGCDGNTYDNACNAAAVGINVETAGACVVGGCQTNSDCPTGEYCEKAIGDCSGSGTCAVMPFICTTIFDPVCGCDGNTYSNACNAAGAGVSVDHLGPC